MFGSERVNRRMHRDRDTDTHRHRHTPEMSGWSVLIIRGRVTTMSVALDVDAILDRTRDDAFWSPVPPAPAFASSSESGAFPHHPLDAVLAREMTVVYVASSNVSYEMP